MSSFAEDLDRTLYQRKPEPVTPTMSKGELYIQLAKVVGGVIIIVELALLIWE